MSRSVKHFPGGGFTGCKSEKDDKRIYNRRYRRAVKQAIHHEEEVMPHLREKSDTWSMGKDGRQYWPEPTEKEYRNPYRYIWSWMFPESIEKAINETTEEKLEKDLREWKRWMRK